MKSELSRLYEHIDDIEIAMLTTRRTDGHLQSRAMGRKVGAQAWTKAQTYFAGSASQ